MSVKKRPPNNTIFFSCGVIYILFHVVFAWIRIRIKGPIWIRFRHELYLKTASDYTDSHR